MTNPPPVVKSQGWGTKWALTEEPRVNSIAAPTSSVRPAVVAILLVRSFLRMIPSPIVLMVRNYWIPAFAEAITTSARGPKRPETVAWRAFTVMPDAEKVCSLITTRPPGIEIVWLGSPVTATGTPLIARLSMTELPLLPPPSTDCARASTESAEIPTRPDRSIRSWSRAEPPR